MNLKEILFLNCEVRSDEKPIDLKQAVFPFQGGQRRSRSECTEARLDWSVVISSSMRFNLIDYK